ncbi:hypothetical protein SEA_CULVER_164 [Gordonia phage Culver]|nr:hypothetical protein SEA_CULVER_164 [Gordonia phage Culver]
MSDDYYAFKVEVRVVTYVKIDRNDMDDPDDHDSARAEAEKLAARYVGVLPEGYYSHDVDCLSTTVTEIAGM